MKWIEFQTLDAVMHLVNVETIVEAHPDATAGRTVLTFSGKEDAIVQKPYDEIKKILLNVSQP